MNQSSISETILSFTNQLEDRNHRYLSWEHCYRYFREPVVDVDKGCLHLSFYLASWGMYRGSSFLLWKDYLIHKQVVEKLLSVRDEFQNINFSSVSDSKLKDIISLSDWVTDCYKNNTGLVNGKKRETVPTQVLITKILLGTLGCVPAFDRFFVDGLSIHKISPKSFSVKGLEELVKFYLKHQDEIDEVGKKIKVGNEPYPTMKLIDMYFWELGVENQGNRNVQEDHQTT